MAFHVPKLIIQPFIENAFFHAFHERNEGYIYVLVSREANALVCEVIDNGIGMKGFDNGNNPQSSISNSHFFSGIGIRNVHDRIALLYGEEYGVTIVSNIGEGTRVKIKLPLLRYLKKIPINKLIANYIKIHWKANNRMTNPHKYITNGSF